MNSRHLYRNSFDVPAPKIPRTRARRIMPRIFYRDSFLLSITPMMISYFRQSLRELCYARLP